MTTNMTFYIEEVLDGDPPPEPPPDDGKGGGFEGAYGAGGPQYTVLGGQGYGQPHGAGQPPPPAGASTGANRSAAELLRQQLGGQR